MRLGLPAYEIERRRKWSNEAEFTTLLADTGSAATSYLDTTAAAEDELYQYRVSAWHGGIKSSASNSVKVAFASQEELRPTGLTLEGGSSNRPNLRTGIHTASPTQEEDAAQQGLQ